MCVKGTGEGGARVETKEFTAKEMSKMVARFGCGYGVVNGGGGGGGVGSWCGS